MPSARDTNAEAARGRLFARPTLLVEQKNLSRGLFTLCAEDSREALLAVFRKDQTDVPLPLVLLFHGAGGNAEGGLAPLLPLAERVNLLILAPSSRQQTWDMLAQGYGEDVRFIDEALASVFQHYPVDTSHLALGGFSDGASYALSLGLTNGDLFTHILAFSPGCMMPAARRGMPRIYLSHGTQDRVLPIDYCSRRIVRQLQREHYNVHYHEFDGPHTVPVEIVHEAWQWFSDSLRLSQKERQREE